MADITNPQDVAFCNDRLRVAADKLAQAYYFANATLDVWFANGHSSSIPNNANDTVIDGSLTDGRPILTGQDVHTMMSRISEIVTDYEASGNAKLNTVLAVSVNPDR